MIGYIHRHQRYPGCAGNRVWETGVWMAGYAGATSSRGRAGLYRSHQRSSGSMCDQTAASEPLRSNHSDRPAKSFIE